MYIETFIIPRVKRFCKNDHDLYTGYIIFFCLLLVNSWLKDLIQFFSNAQCGLKHSVIRDKFMIEIYNRYGFLMFKICVDYLYGREKVASRGTIVCNLKIILIIYKNNFFFC